METERYEKIIDYLIKSKSGSMDIINDFWMFLLPTTTRMVNKYKPEYTRFFEIGDLINLSYFALIEAVTRNRYDAAFYYSLVEPQEREKAAVSFLSYYKFCIMSATAKERCATPTTIRLYKQGFSLNRPISFDNQEDE